MEGDRGKGRKGRKMKERREYSKQECRIIFSVVFRYVFFAVCIYSIVS